VSERTLGSNRCANGSPFHIEGTNHRECTGLPSGSMSNRGKEDPRSIERKELRPLVPRVWQQRSCFYQHIVLTIGFNSFMYLSTFLMKRILLLW